MFGAFNPERRGATRARAPRRFLPLSPTTDTPSIQPDACGPTTLPARRENLHSRCGNAGINKSSSVWLGWIRPETPVSIKLVVNMKYESSGSVMIMPFA